MQLNLCLEVSIQTICNSIYAYDPQFHHNFVQLLEHILLLILAPLTISTYATWSRPKCAYKLVKLSYKGPNHCLTHFKTLDAPKSPRAHIEQTPWMAFRHNQIHKPFLYTLCCTMSHIHKLNKLINTVNFNLCPSYQLWTTWWSFPQ